MLLMVSHMSTIAGCCAICMRTLSASDLSRIQNALTFLSPLCRDTREAHKDMMGVTLKTDALLRANR